MARSESPATAVAMTATYRLQVRGGTTLGRARELAGYLDDLGISHLYASPLLHARARSTHGYDVIDPTAVDPALGGMPTLERLADVLRARGMGSPTGH